MIISRIKLKNFGCIKSFDRDFGKGIFIFAGDNGNGKTTVFKAVAMTLFDSYDGSMSEYVNWYGGDSFEIGIDFEHRGFAYNASLYQSLKSKTSERSVTDKTNNQVYTGQEAKDFLKRLFDTELLKSAMLSFEQQLDVVTVKPGERRDYLKKIYDLEFKKQQAQFVDELAALVTRKTEINTELNLLRSKKYEEALLPDLPLTEREYSDAQEDYARKMEYLGALKSDLERYNKAKETISELETGVKNLEKEILETEEGIEKTKKSLSDLPAESEKEALSAKEIIKESEEELNKLSATDPAITDLEKKIGAIEISRVGVFDLETLSKAEKDLSEARQRIKALEGVCPVCGLSKPKTKETETELAEQTAKIPELESRVAGLKAENERIAKLQAENQTNKDLKTKYENEKTLLLERGQTRQRELKTKIDTAKKTLEAASSNLEKVMAAMKQVLTEREKSLKASNDAKTSSEEKLEKLKAETVSDPSGELDAVQREITAFKAKIDDYRRILSEREALAKQIERQKKQKEDDGERVKVLDAELRENSGVIAEIEASQKILKNEFPVYVISLIVRDLESSMNDFLHRVYGGRYVISLIDQKNALRMVYGPKNADAGSGLSSGYEKAVFSLAWKWALSKAQNNRTLMIDEADSAASQENSLIFYRALGDSAKLFDQILIVSHKEQTRDLLENEYGAKVLTFTGGVAA